MGRSRRKGGSATLRQAEKQQALQGLYYEQLSLQEGEVLLTEKGDLFLLSADTIERSDWGDATALTYQYRGELGTLFFVAGEPIYASSPGSCLIRSLRDDSILGRIPPMPSEEEIARQALELAEEETAHLGRSRRQKLVLESKYTGQGRADAFQEHKQSALRILQRAL
jgi:hypothetical protein